MSIDLTTHGPQQGRISNAEMRVCHLLRVVTNKVLMSLWVIYGMRHLSRDSYEISMPRSMIGPGTFRSKGEHSTTSL